MGGEEAEGPVSPQDGTAAQPGVCKAFMRGKCHRGKGCRYLHDRAEKAKRKREPLDSSGGEAAAKRGTRVKAGPDPEPEPEPEPAHWSCSLCTYLNPALFLCCGMCSQEKSPTY
eukprot:TRINITY_DN2335_c0_g2_i3.p1 TRINITY_DN2335_c0_g2~~TRINITY_DN2335_c0_g2_i3.p1  ORF type:complete len:114 (-),score=14.69 TRINITY_DN2335_c0_g2_i3:70-411(-)